MPFRDCSASVSCLPEGWGVVVMSGVAMRALLNVELHFPVFHPDREGLDRAIGRKGLRPPASQVEQRPVARALHCTGGRVVFPLGERAVVVGAAVLDGEQLALGRAKYAE